VACFQKSSLSDPIAAAGIWNARLITTASPASADQNSSDSPAAIKTPSLPALTCPSANGTTYISSNGFQLLVLCSTDLQGYDIGMVQMTGTHKSTWLAECAEACGNDDECQLATLSGSKLYHLVPAPEA